MIESQKHRAPQKTQKVACQDGLEEVKIGFGGLSERTQTVRHNPEEGA